MAAMPSGASRTTRRRACGRSRASIRVALQRAGEVERDAVARQRDRIISTPAALEPPPSSDHVGAAISTMPASPATRPTIWRRGGRRRTISAATMAVKIGVAPFSMPVTLDETRCSASGNSDSGIATHTTPSSASRGHAARGTGCGVAWYAGDDQQPEHDAQPRHEERFERLETLGDEKEARTPDQARQRRARPSLAGRVDGSPGPRRGRPATGPWRDSGGMPSGNDTGAIRRSGIRGGFRPSRRASMMTDGASGTCCARRRDRRIAGAHTLGGRRRLSSRFAEAQPTCDRST